MRAQSLTLDNNEFRSLFLKARPPRKELLSLLTIKALLHLVPLISKLRGDTNAFGAGEPCQGSITKSTRYWVLVPTALCR